MADRILPASAGLPGSYSPEPVSDFPVRVSLDPDWPIVDLASRLAIGALRLSTGPEGLSLIPAGAPSTHAAASVLACHRVAQLLKRATDFNARGERAEVQELIDRAQSIAAETFATTGQPAEGAL